MLRILTTRTVKSRKLHSNGQSIRYIAKMPETKAPKKTSLGISFPPNKTKLLKVSTPFFSSTTYLHKWFQKIKQISLNNFLSH